MGTLLDCGKRLGVSVEHCLQPSSTRNQEQDRNPDTAVTTPSIPNARFFQDSMGQYLAWNLAHSRQGDVQ